MYHQAAGELGSGLAQAGFGVVYGASDQGTMKDLAEAVLAVNGTLVGITFSVLEKTARSDFGDLIVTETLAERKQMMMDRSDAFVVMPGGIGTLDEVLEVLELKKHDLHQKPVVFVNTNGFWDGMKSQLEQMAAEGFLKKDLGYFAEFVDTPAAAITYLTDSL